MSWDFGGKFNFSLENIFAAMNFKEIKDNFSRKFAEISQTVQ
jgi:hypothetical protein